MVMRADKETCSTCGRDIPRLMECWGTPGACVCVFCHRAEQDAAAREKRREALAEVSHDIWSHWMRWMFTVCAEHENGSLTIPASLVERWSRQVHTPYAGLPEAEKESDREQADRILAVLTELPR